MPCPKGALTRDFRTQQCQTYNGKNFDLPDIPYDVKWIPKYAGSEWTQSVCVFFQFTKKCVCFFHKFLLKFFLEKSHPET